MPEVTVLSRTPYVTVSKDQKLEHTTFVVYRDKDGRVGTIVVGKASPSDADVEAEVKKRLAAK